MLGSSYQERLLLVFCTDATACRPLDDNFLPMNVHGYWYADKT
jgi:hypothetical protein